MTSWSSSLPHRFPRLSSAALISGVLLLSGFAGPLSPTSVLAATTTASGTLAQGYALGTTSFVVDVTSPCIFSGPNPVSIGGFSPETLNPSNISALNVPGPGQQTLITSFMANAHPAGAVVTQTVPDCAAPTGTGQLCIKKFSDLNSNGVWDPFDLNGTPFELLLPNWTFTIIDATGGSHTVTTGPDGTVCIDLPTGLATITESPQSLWYSTTPQPVPSLTQTGTIFVGQTTTLLFGNHYGTPPPVGLTGQLCLTKFSDLNSSGAWNTGEPYLVWTFTITDANNVPHTLTTDASGRPTCIYLPEGAATITESLPLGWTQTAPTPLGPYQVKIDHTQQTNVVFGNHQATGTLCVVKFNDVNGDGINNNEPLLAGWGFDIVGNGTTQYVKTAPWQVSGGYCNDLSVYATIDLTPGAYTVSEPLPLPAGWTQTAPTPQPSPTVQITAGNTITISFGNHQASRPGVLWARTTSALGNTTVGPFSFATKIQSRGKYITWRVDGGVALAGQTLQVWVYKKYAANGKWIGPTMLTTRRANASGVAYLNIRTGGILWLSLRPVLPVAGATPASWGPTSIGRWR